jgi:hypothetical protein
VSSNAKSLLIGLLWFLGGGTLGGMTAVLFGIGALGGMHSPPPWWWTVVVYGAFVQPFVLAFGWVPVVVQIKRDRPALKLALFSLAASGLLWLGSIIAWEMGRPKV